MKIKHKNTESAKEILEDLEKRYDELIMAVARKFPNESRHQTALRYIKQAESVELSSEAYCAAERKL